MKAPRDAGGAAEDRRRDLEMRLRLAFLEGAEERSREALGRGLTLDELRRVTGRFQEVATRR